jgi:hypothetical protein
MEPARRLIYRTRHAAEVLGYTIGSMRQFIHTNYVEAWPWGTRYNLGHPQAVFNFIPHRAIEANIIARGGSKFIHLPPVWAPFYKPAECRELLDLGPNTYLHLVRKGDLEVVSNGRRGQWVTRLSMDDWLERLEAGEFSEVGKSTGSLPVKYHAPQFQPPVETRVLCGWCGKKWPKSDGATVGGRADRPDGPRRNKRRVCRACVAERIETVRGIIANGRPSWLDDAWVEWSKAADELGIPYDGLQANMRSALKAGVVRMADFLAGGILYSDLHEPTEAQPEEEDPEPDDVTDAEMVERLLGA